MSKDIILLVEDDEEDQILIKEAFEDLPNEISIHMVNNGEMAITYLTDLEQNNSELPILIIMDVNMPRKDGKETLKDIRKSENLKHIPIIIFTTSSSQDDINECYYLGANSYLIKPDDFNGFEKIINIFEKYWLKTSELPNY